MDKLTVTATNLDADAAFRAMSDDKRQPPAKHGRLETESEGGEQRPALTRPEAIIEAVSSPIMTVDRDGLIESVNPGAEELLGYREYELLGAGIDTVVPSLTIVGVTTYLKQATAQVDRVSTASLPLRRLEIRSKRGGFLPVDVQVRETHVSGRECYVLSLRDNSELRRTEASLFRAKERAQVVLESIRDAVIVTDAVGTVDYLNPVAEALLNWTNRAAQGKSVRTVFPLQSDQEREDGAHPVLNCLREGCVLGAEEIAGVRTRDGEDERVEFTVSPVHDGDGRLVGSVLVFREVGGVERLREQLSYQSRHDSLTGLTNRAEFDERLNAALAACRRDKNLTHVLLYLDLDQFKVVNDTCGHGAGDELLQQVTHVLQNHIRGSDALARMGGDEFAVLLDDCTAEIAVPLAEKVRQALRDFSFNWGEQVFEVGVSIGVVMIDGTAESKDAILSAADVACYAAKEDGRNRVHVYSDEDAPECQREMQWVARVTKACEQNRLDIYYQPIVPLSAPANAPTHYELLLRMRDENDELVPPNVFIPAAERYNLMPTIDRWVVRSALTALAHRRVEDRDTPAYTLAINLSGTSLSESAFLEDVKQLFDELDLSPGAICFEITETAAITNLAQVAQFMRSLKARGCLFSLDDFGSGLSSFTYLKSLPVDFLKIDGYFVRSVATNKVDLTMIDAIHRIGKALGIRTIAECIEDNDSALKLQATGVEYGQGYYFARPRPVASRRTFSHAMTGVA